MNIIIFSKDRPAQLDLLLRSMERFMPTDDRISVLMHWSDVQYAAGYSKLMQLWHGRNIRWHRQMSFKNDLIRMVDPMEMHTLLLVDDDVMINPWNADASALLNPSIACISLRLNPRLTYCQPTGGRSVAYINERNEVYWPAGQGDYGYPMSLDGTIFRSADILPMIRSLQYSNPNELEAAMAASPIDKNWIKCYDKSTVLNLPLNQVQTAWNNPHGKVSAKYLNWKFLKGFMIDLEPYVGYDNNACHVILPVKMVERTHTGGVDK